MPKKPLSLLVVMAICTSPAALAGIDDGLIAHYPLDGNALDASGNGHNGTEVGAIAYVDGAVGAALGV